MRRRSALAAVTLVVGIAALATSPLRPLGRRAIDGLAWRINRTPRLDPFTGVGQLTADEMAQVVALGETLLPPGTPDAAAFVREHVMTSTARVPGLLSLYRRALPLLDHAARRIRLDVSRFPDLALADRDRALATMLGTYGEHNGPGVVAERWWSPRILAAFRTFIVHDIVTAFYDSPRGWRVVGHDHAWSYPAADPRGYTRPPGG
jgi:hypothetical protein